MYTIYPHAINNGYDRGEERELVRIVTGGAPNDRGEAYMTTEREEYFPFEIIKSSLSIKVKEAEASQKEDRIRILNVIIGPN